jgi:hypothetical protein
MPVSFLVFSLSKAPFSTACRGGKARIYNLVLNTKQGTKLQKNTECNNLLSRNYFTSIVVSVLRGLFFPFLAQFEENNRFFVRAKRLFGCYLDVYILSYVFLLL